VLKFLKVIREFTKNLKLIKPSLNDEAKIEEINQNMDIIDEFSIKVERLLGEMETNKLDRGGFLGTAKNLLDEISKIASTTQFGRIKIGTNLQMDENGFLHGNPAVDISGKLDKGNVAEKYNTAEKIGIELDKKQNSTDLELNTNAKTIVGGINEIEEKFKNFCPFPVNSIFLSLDNSNPATLFLGTTWEKQEGRFLIGSSLDYPLGTTGGNSTITLTEANMPRHRHRVDNFTLTTQPHTHPIKYSKTNNVDTLPSCYGSGNTTQYTHNTGEGGGGNTGTASPYTSYVGSGTAFNNMPPYLVCNIWKRLS
jgi:hypothetical protein